MKNNKLLRSGMVTFAIILACIFWMLPTPASAEETSTEPVTSIIVSGSSYMVVGEEQTLTAFVFMPMDATTDYEWSSSDPSIVTVDASGKVTAIGEGTATITATATNGGVKDSMNITVSGAAVESITIEPSEIWVIKEETGPYDLNVTVLPSNANQTVGWSGNKDGEVQINKNDNGEGYNINGISIGTFDVIARTVNGKEATLTVHVCDPTESLTLDPTSLDLEVGDESTITASVKPETACPNLTWTSSDDKIASVADGKVTAIAAGTATITATSLDGKTATCEVTVKEATAEEQTVIVYRLYNPCTGEHLYTTDAHEKDVLYQNHGWGFEGIGWYAPSSGEKVYRLFQPGLDNHLYTTDVNEVNVLTSKYGWVKDNNGEAIFYSGGDVPIYRVYNAGLKGMHHMTTDLNEYNTLPKYGWAQEGLKLNAQTIGSPISTTQYYKK